VLSSFISNAFAFKSSAISAYSDTCIQCESIKTNLKNAHITESIAPILLKYAIILDTTIESISNIALYEFIDEWLGVSYKYGGSDKSGIDCSSFAGLLYQQIFNLQLPRTSVEQSSLITPSDRENLKEGDLVFFSLGKKRIGHVGVYLGGRKFVHASTKKGVTIDNLDYEYYLKRYVSGGWVVEDKVTDYNN
jgi:lipoprotein Spr